EEVAFGVVGVGVGVVRQDLVVGADDVAAAGAVAVGVVAVALVGLAGVVGRGQLARVVVGVRRGLAVVGFADQLAGQVVRVQVVRQRGDAAGSVMPDAGQLAGRVVAERGGDIHGRADGLHRAVDVGELPGRGGLVGD